MSQPESQRNMIALVRARPTKDWFAFFSSIGLLLTSVLTVALLLCYVIAFSLLGVPTKLWEALVHSGPQFLGQLLGIAPDAAHQRGVTFIDLCAIFLLLVGWACLRAKRCIKETRGLWIFSRLPQTSPLPFSLREFLSISLPPWLLTLVIDAPSPASVLEIVQEQHSSTAAWSEELIAFLEHAQQEPPPLVSMLVSLSDRVTISLVGRDGKQESIPITHTHRAALIALLAGRPRGTWVSRQEIFKKIYSTNKRLYTTNKKGYATKDDLLFASHISRIHETLNKRAIEAGWLDPNTTEEEDSLGRLKLFEYDDSGLYHMWRLLVTCEVEVFSRLTSLFEQIHVTGEEKLSLEGLRRECHLIMQEYGKGYLAAYQQPNTIWPWAREPYISYRDMCLSVLEYAAERELSFAAEQLTPREQYEAFGQAAMLYGWRVSVALGIVPDMERCEDALCQCLALYRRLGDISAARQVFQAYVDYMMRRDARWTPRLKITDIWPEATSL